mmetsp:Transcript_30521/g.48829  ORF Transcript_30521/g.48829 Transcript_30521/m.48829 type:complete len:734 (+) Transcript_30521:106-2307(+)
MMLAKAAMALAALAHGADGYLVGVGSFDITGPPADVNLMGYAMPEQVSSGIFFRTRARAFVIGNDQAQEDRFVFSDYMRRRVSNAPTRVAFVSADIGMASYAVTAKVAEKLEKRFPGVYSEENVCISGTHTHSATAGFLQNMLFQVTSLGFVRQSFDAFVDGVVEAITIAHNNAKSGRKMIVSVGEMEAGKTNINRSPSAYMNNPEEERKKYKQNTDLDMTVLRFEESDGKPLGMLNWYSVHGTSIPNTNGLINGDNKGYASQLFEAWYNGVDTPTGTGEFVAAFASTNLGDVSPNINGTYCSDSGKPCEELHSTCAGKNENCHGRGPSKDPYESCKIIGTRQAEYAKKLFDGSGNSRLHAASQSREKYRANVDGEIAYIHAFRDMANITVALPDGGTAKTCKPAMGYSFAAGTTDGPGMFNFIQGDTSTKPFWEFLRNFIKKPSKELQECQHPKPVLLPTGEMDAPYPWDPRVMPLQIFKIGKQLAIISVPSEFTTMAGRRLRDKVRDTLVQKGALEKDGVVVIAGLANEYSSYVTTFEEFQIQRYEGASTLYGPHTHQAYVQELAKMASALAENGKVEPGPTPQNLLDKQICLLPNALLDAVPWGKKYGQVDKDVGAVTFNLTAKPDAVISCTFFSANPRHNIRTNSTFLLVERRNGNDWETVSTDSDFDTRYIYKRTKLLFSRATIEWRPEESLRKITPGTYRLTHQGDRKVWGKIQPFTGHSSPFQVVY